MSRSSAPGVLRSILDWWIAELVAAMPGIWPTAPIELGRRRLIAFFDGERLALAEVNGGKHDGTSLDKWAGSPSARELSISDVDERDRALLENARRRRVPVVLRLADELAITITDRLPATVGSEVAAVLRHRISILSPLTEHSACFDIVTTRRCDRSTIEIDLVIAPKRTVERAHGLLEAIGLVPDVVDVAPAGTPVGSIECWTAPVTFDLERRGGPPPVPRSFRRAAGVGLAGVLVAVILTWSGFHDLAAPLADARQRHGEAERRLAELDSAVEGVRSLARDVAQLRQELDEAPSMLRSIERLSEVMPDDVWLSELMIDGPKITLRGWGREVTRLPELLERQADFAAAQLAPTIEMGEGPRPTALGKASRFQLTVRVESAASGDVDDDR